MGLSDYSDLEKEINEAPEPKLLPAGSEIKARIIAVNSGVSEKNGAKWYAPVFDVPADPMVIPFNDFMWDLAEADKIGDKAYSMTKYQFREFASAFDIDYSRPFDWEDDLPGKEGWLITGIAKDKTGQYPDKNSVKRYIVKK